MKRVYIQTFGCQMNEQDSRQMYGLFAAKGFERAGDVHNADLILLNTCSIREKAEHKIYSELGRLRPLKEDNPRLIVGVAGCVAEQEKEKLKNRFPFLDLIFGPDHIRHLPQMVDKITGQHHQETLVHTGFDARQDFEFVNVLPAHEESPVKAFVNIQKGCDNICSFCIVPFVRGREVSRPYAEIIAEIECLVDLGVKEVTLLGQNVNSYGLKNTGGITFAGLLALIAKKTRLKRLRFTTSHPKDVGDELIDEFANNPILAPHFHLPVQSGNDRILQLMRRGYTREKYMKIVERLHNLCPGLSLSTDIIVGFPTETEGEFLDTLKLMREVGFAQSFSFVYSPRPHTKAGLLADDVPLAVKQERLQRLQALDRKITLQKNTELVGTLQEVLVELTQGEDPLHMGRTGTNRIVHFTGEGFKPGEMASVRVDKANPHSLYGRIPVTQGVYGRYGENDGIRAHH